MIILETNSKISNEIMRIFVQKLYVILKEKALIIKQRIKDEHIRIWKATETYDSLLNGDLNHEFGFKKGTAQGKVDAVLIAMSNSLRVLPKIFKQKGGVYTGFMIEALSKSISDEIFQMQEAEVETEKTLSTSFSNDFLPFSGGQQLGGKTLPWLNWLLREGNQIIIYNYRYEDIVAPNSRSGKGLMIYDESEAWRVPAKYSGTKNSHWLIRALKQERKHLISEYGRIINEVIRS